MADNLTPATRTEKLLNNPGSLTPATRLEKFIQRSGGGGSGGLSNAVKAALMDCFEHVAWEIPKNASDPSGQDYIDALDAALYPVTPPSELLSISAVYTQTGTVYEGADLDTLKSDLVVTATYEDETTEEITRYSLSGSLTVGTSTITVTYEGKTDTFTVTVSAVPIATFEAGAIAKSTDPNAASYRYMYRMATAARARMTVPIVNDGYVFTVTDPTKYQLAAYDPESLTVYQKTIQNVGTVDCYYGGTKAPSWTSSDSVTTDCVWLALKKLDNTEFTAEELADGASAVFTFTKTS